MKNEDSMSRPAPDVGLPSDASGELNTEAGAGDGMEALALARLRAENSAMTREWTEDLIRHGKERRALEAQLAAMTAERDALVGAAYEAAAQVAWDNDAKAFRARYEVDYKGRQRWDWLQLRSAENQCMNIIAEDTSEAIRSLATPDAQAALEAVKAKARAEGMRKAADICKALREHPDTTEEEAIGAMACCSEILAAAEKEAGK